MKPISYKQEMGDKERTSLPLQGPAQFQNQKPGVHTMGLHL